MIYRFLKKNNPHISVNVFQYREEKDSIGVVWKTLQRKDNHVNLLLLRDNDKYHFTYIINLSKLLNTYVCIE